MVLKIESVTKELLVVIGLATWQDAHWSPSPPTSGPPQERGMPVD
jgi:hypothetical protein